MMVGEDITAELAALPIAETKAEGKEIAVGTVLIPGMKANLRTLVEESQVQAVTQRTVAHKVTAVVAGRTAMATRSRH
jgi:hypothetical protein